MVTFLDLIKPQKVCCNSFHRMRDDEGGCQNGLLAWLENKL